MCCSNELPNPALQRGLTVYTDPWEVGHLTTAEFVVTLRARPVSRRQMLHALGSLHRADSIAQALAEAKCLVHYFRRATDVVLVVAPPRCDASPKAPQTLLRVSDPMRSSDAIRSWRLVRSATKLWPPPSAVVIRSGRWKQSNLLWLVTCLSGAPLTLHDFLRTDWWRRLSQQAPGCTLEMLDCSDPRALAREELLSLGHGEPKEFISRLQSSCNFGFRR